jgi:predicted deacylase
MDRVKIIGEGSPVVGIIGLVHGNEPCGGFAIDSLEGIKPKKGTLILIKANLEAAKLNQRSVEINLNRSFPGKEDGKLEEKIAYELFPFMKMCDYLLDIHSTSEDSEPFMLVIEDDESKTKIASQLGIKNYIDIGGHIKGTTMDDEGVKVVVECGQHDEELTKQVAVQVANNFLKATGIIGGKAPREEISKYKVIRQMVIDNPDGFKFSNEIEPFKLVKEGDLIGSYPDKKLHASIDFYPVLITKKPGNQYLFMMIGVE